MPEINADPLAPTAIQLFSKSESKNINRLVLIFFQLARTRARTVGSAAGGSALLSAPSPVCRGLHWRTMPREHRTRRGMGFADALHLAKAHRCEMFVTSANASLQLPKPSAR